MQYTNTKKDEERAVERAIEGDYASFNARILSDRTLVKLRRDAETQGRWRLREILLEEEARRLRL